MKRFQRTILIVEAILVLGMAILTGLAYAYPDDAEKIRIYRKIMVEDLKDVRDSIQENIDIEPGSLMDLAIQEIDDEFTKKVYERLPKIELPDPEEIDRDYEVKLHNLSTSEELQYDSLEPEEYEELDIVTYSINPSTMEEMLSSVAPRMISALIFNISEESLISPVDTNNFTVYITKGEQNTNGGILGLFESTEFTDGNGDKYEVITHEVYLDNRKIANIHFAIDADTDFVMSMQLQVDLEPIVTNPEILMTFTKSDIQERPIAKILGVTRVKQYNYGLMQPWCSLAAIETVRSQYASSIQFNFIEPLAKTVLPVVMDDDSNYDCNGIWTEAAKDTSENSPYNIAISQDPLMAKRFHNGLNNYQVRDLLGLTQVGQSTVYNETNCGSMTSAVSKIKSNKPYILALATDGTGHAVTVIGYVDSDIIIGSDPTYKTAGEELFMLYVNRNKAPNGKTAYLSTVKYFWPASGDSDGVLYNIENTIVPNNKPSEKTEISYKDIVDYYYLMNINEVIEKQSEIVPKYFIGDLYRSEYEEESAEIYFEAKLYPKYRDKDTMRVGKTDNEELVDRLDGMSLSALDINIESYELRGMVESHYETVGDTISLIDIMERMSTLSLLGVNDAGIAYLNNTRGMAVYQFLVENYVVEHPEITLMALFANASEGIPDDSMSTFKVNDATAKFDNTLLDNREREPDKYIDRLLSIRRHDAVVLSNHPPVTQLQQYFDDGYVVFLTLEIEGTTENEVSTNNRRTIMLYGMVDVKFKEAVGGYDRYTEMYAWVPYLKMNGGEDTGITKISIEEYENNRISINDAGGEKMCNITGAVAVKSFSIDKDTYNKSYNTYGNLE